MTFIALITSHPRGLFQQPAKAIPLSIHKAVYGIEGKRDKPVVEYIQKQVETKVFESVNFVVNNENFGGDPIKDTHKRLKLTYSSGGEQRREIIVNEGDRLVILTCPHLSYQS
jgi:hypothetical protein